MTNLCRAHVYVCVDTCRALCTAHGNGSGASLAEFLAARGRGLSLQLSPRVFHQLNVCSLSVFVPVLNARLANVKLTPRVHG